MASSKRSKANRRALANGDSVAPIKLTESTKNTLLDGKISVPVGREADIPGFIAWIESNCSFEDYGFVAAVADLNPNAHGLQLMGTRSGNAVDLLKTLPKEPGIEATLAFALSLDETTYFALWFDATGVSFFASRPYGSRNWTTHSSGGGELVYFLQKRLGTFSKCDDLTKAIIGLSEMYRVGKTMQGLALLEFEHYLTTLLERQDPIAAITSTTDLCMPDILSYYRGPKLTGDEAYAYLSCYTEIRSLTSLMTSFENLLGRASFALYLIARAFVDHAKAAA